MKTLLGDPVRLYDDPPHDAIFPYAVFGDGTQSDSSSVTGDMSEHRVLIHVWSRYAGRREVKQIAGRIRTVLHDAPLVLTEHTLINLRCETIEFSRARDGRAYHALARFRAVTETP